MSLTARLEAVCHVVDAVLAAHGVAGRVAGGYVAGDGLLFSLTDGTFVDDQVRWQLQAHLGVSAVAATVGVILVHGWLSAAVARPAMLPATVGVLELIEMHQAERA